MSLTQGGHVIQAFKDHDAPSNAANRSLHEQMDRRRGLQMQIPRVKYILSPSEIPVGQKYVLVTYGENYEQTRQPLGFTITVARQKSNRQ